ncbi:MAG TPA: hypothetical protein VKS44_08760 [Candidatus Acidoferrales bacterium]|nr:hypothetical protein [Candidatus Acidoferrales bacterium]
MNGSRFLLKRKMWSGILGIFFFASGSALGREPIPSRPPLNSVVVHRAIKFDVSRPLRLQPDSGAVRKPAACESVACTAPVAEFDSSQDSQGKSPAPPSIPPAARAVEQTSQGNRPPVPLVESFDGLGAGFEGPQGTAHFRNPSDNSLAVGPNHIVQIVNSRLAVYTKKGAEYQQTGKVLYGPAATDSVFAGFGGPCETHNNGDAVVRYDQLAGRWLVVMPIFRPLPPSETGAASESATAQTSEHGALARQGQASAAGAAAKMPPNPQEPKPPVYQFHRPPGYKPGEAVDTPRGTFAMCYAVSTTSDPLGTYYRYAFERKLFPDYPRPAVWPDGYYVPTSTGDTVIQKHDCIADRNKMLAGQPAMEQCVIIDGVNFLNNADIDGRKLPPPGAPNIMMAAGGTQLKKNFEDDGIYAWKVHVDWNNPANTKADGPVKIPVAPYHYLCDGQLSHCVPQPGTDVRLDVQGDKLMQRLVYRRIGNRESIVGAHSIDTSAGGGGVRWYEFRLDKQRNPYLYQQGTYAPDQFYRSIPSIDMDRKGDIGVGYSFGGTPNFPGQRFAARRAKDPKGLLTFHETVLANGEASQTDGFRWEDYTTTAMDPGDDCTFWYVGDYLKKDDKDYRTKIGGFRVPGCGPKR